MKKFLPQQNVDIDVFGNIAAGKTQLVAAIWRHVKSSDREISEDFAAQLEIVANGNAGLRSEHTEHCSMTVDNHRFNFSIHKGEVLRFGSKEASKPLASNYELNKNRIFMAVVNPFTLDRDVAFQAACSMIAWLQRSSLTIENSVRLTFSVMFNMTEFSDKNTAFTRLIRPEHKNKKVFFNFTDEKDVRYRVGSCQQDFDSGEPISVSNFGQDLRIAVDGIVDKHSDGHSQLSDVFEKAEYSMVVLSHMDLSRYMLGFDIGNFDKACDLIYRDGDRTKGVQLFGKYVSTSFQWDIAEHTTESTNIVQYDNGTIKYRSDSPDFPKIVVKNLMHLSTRKQKEFSGQAARKKILYASYVLLIAGFIDFVCGIFLININQIMYIFSLIAIVIIAFAWRVLILSNADLKI